MNTVKVRLPISLTTAFVLENPHAAKLLADTCKAEALNEMLSDLDMLAKLIKQLRRTTTLEKS